MNRIWIKIEKSILIFALIIPTIVCLYGLIVVIEARALSGKIVIANILLLLWAIMPYVMFLALSNSIHANKDSGIPQFSTILAAFYLLIMSLIFYYEGFFSHPSSTSILILIFLPLYLIFGALAIILLSSFTRKIGLWLKRKSFQRSE